MLKYDEFKEAVISELRNIMSVHYPNYRLVVSQVPRINRTIDYLSISGDDEIISSGISLHELYGDYRECGNLQTVFQSWADSIQNAIEKKRVVPEQMDKEKIKEQVIFALIHKEQNKELLKIIPHKTWHDLAIIYRWIICKPDNVNYLVTNELAKEIGMDEESLFQAAALNTIRLYPPKVERMESILNELEAAADRSDEIEELLRKVMPKIHIYVITNSERFNGAAGVLYENILYRLAQKIGKDLFLLPSSIHDMIAVPASDDVPQFVKMVQDINFNKVNLEEQLSNQVYYYNKDTRKVTMATDLPFEGFKSAKE